MSTTAATAPKEIKSYVDLSTDNVSMDALLANEQKNEFVENSIVPGKIVEKRNDGALVDIGYKAEGFIPAAEFRNWADVKVGDQVDVYLEEIENENSMPGISLQKANFIKSWNKITSEYGEGSVITGLMKHRVKGGIAQTAVHQHHVCRIYRDIRPVAEFRGGARTPRGFPQGSPLAAA